MSKGEMRVGVALRDATDRLAKTSDTPRLDAEILMAHALGCTRSELLLHRLGKQMPTDFALLVERRMAHEPIAYIVGEQEFWGLPFAVSPAVLIPRADSETLVETAIAAFPDQPPQRILDLGTGSGALLLAALSHWEKATGIGIERSADALEIAKANAEKLDLAARSRFLAADWHEPDWIDTLALPFDLVLCNPPYVETGFTLMPDVRDHEPAGALFAGVDGLDEYRHLIPLLSRLLEPAGAAIFEIGYRQGEAVRTLALANGFDIKIMQDMEARNRAVLLRFAHRPGN